jgi:HAE1 family hydrophobic/amphiphilic exporter-1
MGGSYYLYQELPGGFFPDSDEGEFDVEVELPPGTKLVKTAEVLRDFSQRILDMDVVSTVVTEIGQSGFRTESNTGEITVKLTDPGKRDQSTNDISRKVERMLQRPGVDLDVGGRRGRRGGFGRFGNRIRFTLIGPEIEVLQALADKITRVAETDTNVISVNTGRSDPIPELHYKANRTRCPGGMAVRLHSYATNSNASP